MRLYFGTFVSSLFPLLACGNPGSPEPPAFQTDAPGYTLTTTSIGYEANIGFVFTNPNSSPVYIVNCGGATSLRLEKLLGDGWVTAWAPFIPDCLSPPIVVGARAQHRGIVRVVDCSFRSNCAPKFAVSEIPGEYRIVWDDVLWSFDDRKYPFGKPLPLKHRISNTFTLSTGSP